MAMAADHPIVSVCIANYNGIGIIEACIESVLAQDWDMAVEIIVHDDASGDGSVDFIRRHYPSIKLIESPDNVGFCVANNRMAAMAQGEYMLLLNNDAELLPDALRTLFEEAKSLGQPGILSLPQFDHESGDLVDRGCLLDPFFNPAPNLDPQREKVAMVIGACLWIPKKLWDEMGGFPEWFNNIGEDMYLCCRARLAGYPILTFPRSGYRHWQGKSFGGNRMLERRLSTTYRRRALSERNKTYVMILCSPTPLILPLLVLHLALLLLEGLLLSMLKRDIMLWQKIYAPLVPALWGNRSKLLDLREEIQRSRQIGFWAWLTAFRALPYKLKMLLNHGVPEIK